MRRYPWNLMLLLVAFTICSGLQAQPVTVGGEFQVNTYTSSDQSYPAVAAEPGGDFVVVWESYDSGGTDSDSYSIQGQRYASDGSGLGGEFQVNTYTTSTQLRAAVAVESSGDFVVVWYSYGSGGTDSSVASIQGQRYASDGSVLGGQFQVNTYTTSYQRYPAVAVESSGDFVVAWESYGSGGSDSDFWSIQGQRYASDGSGLGGEFQVNAYTTSYQRSPAVTAESSGDFVVVWHSYGSGGTDSLSYSIQGQRYASDGSVLGSEFQVNTYTTSSQRDPAVTAEPDGNFVVVWMSNGSGGTDSSGSSIQGQRYASDGAALDSEFQVNTYTTNYQKYPAVAVESGGDFVVVWHSYGSGGPDSSDSSVQGQRYASDGSALGGQFQVNTYTTSSQRRAAVAAEPEGDFVVVWMSHGSGGTDSSGSSIQGQRFAGPSIFLDGFESGDTSAW